MGSGFDSQAAQLCARGSMDRAPDYESVGCRFDSYRARFFFKSTMTDHDLFMNHALRLAQQAYQQGEVPVGAVVVKDHQIIGRGYNQTELLKDASAHAEMIAMTAAAQTLKNWRLTDCILYSTLEPCLMCISAAVLFRISLVVYGTEDPKFGGCVSLANIPQIDKLNHKFAVIGGVQADKSKSLMQAFFRERREENQKKSGDNHE